MSYKFKNHFFLILIIVFTFNILIGCQLQEPTKPHGILFLENRSNKLVLNSFNKNDVVKIIGNPHRKSISDEDNWIYMERVLTKGSFHKLGQNVLKTNNILVLTFNKYGVLTDKKFLNKDDLQKISFSKKITENDMSKQSFVTQFLQSLKQKMYRRK